MIDASLPPKYPSHHLSSPKLSRPQCSVDVVTRPRVMNLLERMADLTLVCAPAGCGKTTLISHWLERCPHPAAWLTLDVDDSDLNPFLTHLILAVQKVFPNFGNELLEHLRANTVVAMAVLSEMLYNAIDAVDEEFILVLDDYHLLVGSEVHSLLTELLRYQIAPLHLVISARRDPPLPVVRLRAHIRVIEIRGADLRFTEEETRYLFGESQSELLNEEEIGDLVRGTEGWVMSLRFAKLYLNQEQGFASLRQALEVGKQRAMDFLADEVFTNLPQDTQTFLMQTSVLDQLTARSCAVVSSTGITEANAAATLNWLTNNGIFTAVLDDAQEWYRYHALFRQLVRRQMHRHYSREQIAGLHRRARMWCLEENLPGEAIHHALAAGDFADALQIFADVRPVLMNAGDWPQLAQLIRHFPQHFVTQQLELQVARAWVAQSRYNKMEVYAYLKAAADTLAGLKDRPSAVSGSDADQIERLEGELEILHTYACYWNSDLAGVIAHGTCGLELAPPHLWGIRVLAVLFMSVAYQANGDLPSAYALFDASNEWANANGRAAQMQLLTARTFLPSIGGDLRAVAENADQLLALSEGVPWTDRTALTYYFKASVHYYRNEPKEVEAVIAELMPRRYQSIPQAFVQSMCILAFAHQAQHRPAEANHVAAETLIYAKKTGNPEFIPLVQALQGDLALRQGRVDDAAQLLRPLAAAPLTPMPFFYDLHMTLIRLYLRQRTHESLRATVRALKSAEELSRIRTQRAILDRGVCP